MKRKYLFVGIAITLIITLVVSAAIVFAGKNFISSLSSEKQKEYLDHESKVAKAEVVANNYKDSDRPKLDDQTIKDIANDMPGFDSIGLIEPIKYPGSQVPMSNEIAKQYNFVTRGIAPYNLIVTGNYVDNPNDGLILNFYVRPKTGDRGFFAYRIPDTGIITLISLSNNKVFTFKTEDGKTGTFDVTSKEGKYKIN